MTKRACAGRSAHGPCAAPVVYRVHDETYACGRHVAWTLRHVIAPGQTVAVTRIA